MHICCTLLYTVYIIILCHPDISWCLQHCFGLHDASRHTSSASRQHGYTALLELKQRHNTAFGLQPELGFWMSKKKHIQLYDSGYSWLQDNMELGVSQLGSSASRGSKKVSNECQALGTCQDHAVTGWEVCDFVTHHSSTLETSQYRLTSPHNIDPAFDLTSSKSQVSPKCRSSRWSRDKRS